MYDKEVWWVVAIDCCFDLPRVQDVLDLSPIGHQGVLESFTEFAAARVGSPRNQNRTTLELLLTGDRSAHRALSIGWSLRSRTPGGQAKRADGYHNPTKWLQPAFPGLLDPKDPSRYPATLVGAW